MTAPETIDFNYPAPDGRDLPVRVAYADREFIFPFLEIAQALMHERAEKMSPSCDAAHERRAKFSNLKYERKCVTLAGLFTCSPISRTDDGTEAASGPAMHFHRWLRAVVLPMLEPEEWPPKRAKVARLSVKWTEKEIARFDSNLYAERELAALAHQLEREAVSISTDAPPPPAKPHALGRSTPQGFEFSAQAIEDVVNIKR
jgi:hypothetical protein